MSTQEGSFVLKRHYDGKSFRVPSNNAGNNSGGDDSKVVGNVASDVKYDHSTVQDDLKRFGEAVDDNVLDGIRRQR